MTRPHDNDNGRLIVDRVRALLRYNPFTGQFFWRVSKGTKMAGSLAGKLHVSGYWIIRIDGKEHRAHRLAWFYTYGEWPEKILDHINTVKNDNRIFSNLRRASEHTNQYNRPAQANNTSGFKGVSKFAGKNLWRAEINVDGKKKYLGSRRDPAAAAELYRAAAANGHGEFARDNDGAIEVAA